MHCYHYGLFGQAEGPRSIELSGQPKIFNGGFGFAVARGLDEVYSWGVCVAKGSSGKAELEKLSCGGTIDAAAGWDHIIAVTGEGCVQGKGWNLSGQAAPSVKESELSYISVWTSIPLGVRVIQVAAGEKHSAALADDGAIWAWGCNAEGQIGVGRETDACLPSCVLGHASANSFLPSRHVSCGARHTCAIDRQGGVHCWGWSLHGQCASDAPTVTSPTAVKALAGLNCVAVAAGLGHTVALTDAGDIYSWGWNGNGQLGLGDLHNRFQPVLVEDAALQDEHVTKVCCGARHTVAMTQAGAAVCCGCNKHGELGACLSAVGSTSFQPLLLGEHLETSSVQTPRQLKLVDIACGWWHTLLLCEA